MMREGGLVKVRDGGGRCVMLRGRNVKVRDGRYVMLGGRKVKVRDVAWEERESA